MDTLPQGLARLPDEIVLVIFDNILLITDKRQFLKTCIKYNEITKSSMQQFENNYEIQNFRKINKYCVEKFTLELCHDKYFGLIPMKYIVKTNTIIVDCLAAFLHSSQINILLELATNNGCDLTTITEIAEKNDNIHLLKWAVNKGYSMNRKTYLYFKNRKI